LSRNGIPAGHFRFGASQTPEGGQILAQYGVTADAVRSMVLIEDGRVFMKSSAALRIARRMQWPWPLAAMCLAVPRLIRDAVYMLISRNRHRLLRNADVCAVPPPELRGPNYHQLESPTMRMFVGIAILAAQLVMVGVARVHPIRFYTWAPFDSQNEFKIQTTVDGRALTPAEIQLAVSQTAAGRSPRSIYEGHVDRRVRRDALSPE
jgi:predicted DCC family thiol-disulfide oxidoreductase YuxK